MKTFGVVLAIVLLVILAGAGVLYTKNQREARSGGEKALADYRSGPSLDTWERPEELVLLLESVRTLDADGAEQIMDAVRPYKSHEAKEEIRSAAIVPDDVPEIALLESAGASRVCNLTGGVAPIADNPFETEILIDNEVIALGKVMAAKAKHLEAAGLQAEAENELLLLLSVGAHLENDGAWTSLGLGLAMQKTALEALAELYAGRGDETAGAAARAMSAQRSVESKREVIAKFPPFLEMSLCDEGLQELATIVQNDSLPRALRLEAIMALNAGYLFDINRVVLGPESKRVETVDGLKIDDPVLSDVASKARTALLEMPFSERRQSVTTMAVLE
jgi:hypothetical protein